MFKMITITKEDLLEFLKEVNYPGFSRDIVSFGMVKDVTIESSNVAVTLQVNSDNEKHLAQLQNEILTKLKSRGIADVKLEIQKPQAQPVQGKSGESPMNQQPIPGVDNIIAIASGKGGVGKSTVAVNLAATLSKNHRVGLLDLDIYGPSLPMLVGLNQQPEITPEKKLIPLDKFNIRLMSFGFINADNAPAIWRGPMVARMTQQFFDDVIWGELDYLILDLPPGTGDIQLTLVQKLALTGAIIVTTPQNLAVLDVKKGADMFAKVNTPVLGVIENMTHFLCPHCSEASEIFPGSGGAKESKRLNVPLLGRIYLSPKVAESSDNGTPFVLQYEDSPISKEYENIAAEIKKLSE